MSYNFMAAVIICSDFGAQKDKKKKDLNDSDNHNGLITHLESDILECEVKKVKRN